MISKIGDSMLKVVLLASLSFLSINANAGELFESVKSIYEKAQPASISDLGVKDIWSCAAVDRSDHQLKIPAAFWIKQFETDPMLPPVSRTAALIEGNIRFGTRNEVTGSSELINAHSEGAVVGGTDRNLRFKKIAGYILIGRSAGANLIYIFSCPTTQVIPHTEVKQFIGGYGDPDVSASDNIFVETYLKKDEVPVEALALLNDGRLVLEWNEIKRKGHGMDAAYNATYNLFRNNRYPVQRVMRIVGRDEVYTARDLKCAHGFCLDDEVRYTGFTDTDYQMKVVGFFGEFVEVHFPNLGRRYGIVVPRKLEKVPPKR